MITNDNLQNPISQVRTMTFQAPLASARWPYYRRPNCAGPMPSSIVQVQGSNVARLTFLRLAPVPKSERWYTDRWNSQPSLGGSMFNGHLLAQALGAQRLAFNYLSIAQIRLPRVEGERVDGGHVSVVVGIDEDSQLVDEVASEIELFLRR
ncbi:hypothetical protein CPLU01_04165 [Colletotrichum plurivorum]|uniref:Uncharacterized protein n=1 Tax=Colletotrichum plurivorum TaxID=2175906 RepID=A0A8H6KR21_9PEZI|nr:hypothetical protein CPLU01_04165 [Colletotrichum plurivorum]